MPCGAALMLLAACGDDSPAMPGDGSSTSGTSLGPTFSGTTGDSTTGDDTEGPVETTTGLDTGDTGTYCETELCGANDECCAVGEECIAGECLAGCDTNVRCGADLADCCEDGQICLADACVTPSGACIDSFDCPADQYCDPDLDECLPVAEPAACEVRPDFDTIELELEWSFTEEQIISAPVVGDIDGDSLPEVVVNTYFANGSGSNWRAEIIALDGTTGNVQFTVVDDPMADSYGSYSRVSIAMGDVNDDGTADVVYAGYPESSIPPYPDDSSIIHAVDGQGQHLWGSHDADDTPHYVYIRNGAITLANLDADDASEVIVGTVIIDNDGTVVFDQDSGNGLGGGTYGSNGNVLGGTSIVADLTGDGVPEVISGRQAWTVNWVDGAPPTVTLDLLWEYSGPDGSPAVADLDQDGDPEVILVGDPAPFSSPYDGQLQILDGATGELWCGIDPTGAMCAGMDMLRTQPVPVVGGGRGGPPIVADFDGDGRPEIGVAGGSAYTVYDVNRMGEDIVVPAGDPPPPAGAVYARWTRTVQDEVTNVTGSSAFDFQGDGAAEVLYGDECFMRIFDGQTGAVMSETENSSWTLHEFPVVADVDDDGTSELLMVANNFQADINCEMAIPGFTPRRGIYAYADASDQWVRTRQVWNGLSYHVTNATSSGLVPASEPNSWEDPILNSYRQNIDRAGLFVAPDLSVSLSLGVLQCGDDDIEIIATIRNMGASSVSPGVDVLLYQGTDDTGRLLGTQPTVTGLLPGEQTQVSWLVATNDDAPADYYVVVDNDAGALGSVSECNEDNNSAALDSITCPDPS